MIKDIHINKACEMFSVTEKAVTPEMRRSAKSLNFTDMY